MVRKRVGKRPPAVWVSLLLTTVGIGLPGHGRNDAVSAARVVKFNKDGKFIKAWGTKGAGPGQFRLPHTIVQDSRGRLIVGDRCGLGATGCTDNRIQIFDTEGKFLDQWTHMGAGALYITKDDTLYVSGNGRISIADARTGKVLDTIEKASGHQIAVDSSGDVYTAGLGSTLRRYTRTMQSGAGAALAAFATAYNRANKVARLEFR